MKFYEQWGWWCLEIRLSSFHPTDHLYPWYLEYLQQFPFSHWRHFEGRVGGTWKIIFLLCWLFLSSFHISGSWRRRGGSHCGIWDVVPTPEQLCAGAGEDSGAAVVSWGHPKSLTPLPTAPNTKKAHQTLIVCQKHLHLAAWSWYMAPALPQSQYHLWHGPLKIISPSESEGGGLGQALVQGTKCLDPAKFKGSLPPTPRRDVAG